MTTDLIMRVNEQQQHERLLLVVTGVVGDGVGLYSRIQNQPVSSKFLWFRATELWIGLKKKGKKERRVVVGGETTLTNPDPIVTGLPVVGGVGL